jgi:hypothetical protein
MGREEQSPKPKSLPRFAPYLTLTDTGRRPDQFLSDVEASAGIGKKSRHREFFRSPWHDPPILLGVVDGNGVASKRMAGRCDLIGRSHRL